MATIHRAYVFDVDSFRSVSEPIIERLIQDDFKALRIKAFHLADEKPHLWRILEDYRFYPDDLGHEEDEFDTIESRTKFWMMIVLSAFWQPIEMQADYVPSITQLMHRLVIDDRVTTQLTIGKAICALLQPQLVSDPITQRKDKAWPFWCNYGLSGWLDKSDIIGLLNHLVSIEEIPQRILDQRDDATVRQIMAYKAAMHMLSTAQQAEKGLFLAILD